MPTYEYRCRDCEGTFTRVARMSQRETTRPNCPSCGSENVEQLISRVFAQTSKKS